MMKLMNKMLCAFFLAGLAVAVFASGGKDAAGAETASNQPVTIKFANYALLESGYTPFWEGVKKGFEEKNPGIKIEWVTAPYGDIMKQVINMAGGGNKVDLVFSEISWVPGFEDAGLSVPVDQVLSKEYLADFYPAVLDSFKINDKVYGLPMYVSPYVIYYNKDLFKAAGLDPAKPPKTYDELLAMAPKLAALKDKNGNKVYAFGQTTASVPVSGASLTGMVFNFGGRVLDTQGKISADNAGFSEMAAMLKLLDDKGYNPQNAKLKDLRNLFALGQLAMYYDQSWGFNGVSAINPEAKNFTASAKPLAGGKGNGASILQAHCLVFMDNGKARRDAVAKFVEYLMTAEVLGDYMQNITPAYPAKKSMANMKLSPVLSGAAGSAENVTPQVFIPALDNLNLELCTLAQAVTVGKKEVAPAIEAFKKSAAAIIAD